MLSAWGAVGELVATCPSPSLGQKLRYREKLRPAAGPQVACAGAERRTPTLDPVLFPLIDSDLSVVQLQGTSALLVLSVPVWKLG